MKAQIVSRRGAVISGAVTVLVLAGVILGVAALSSPREPKPNTGLGLSTMGADAEEYAQQAESALASGDTSAATTLATRALRSDPGNARALAVLSRARRTQASGSSSGGESNQSSSNGSQGTQATTDPDKGFTSKVGDMGKLLPSDFADYFLGDVTSTEGQSQVSATPNTGSQEANQVIWTVREYDSKAAAQQFITKVSKVAFRKDTATLDIDGARAYFGTDGARFATVAYVRGVYVFEVIATANGIAPNKLKSFAQKAGKAFADSPK